MNSDPSEMRKKILNGNIVSSEISDLVAIKSIDENDAKLILKLRNQETGNFLKKGAESLKQQISYLEQYIERFKRNEEIYYKIFDKKKDSFEGVVRLTQLTNKSVLNWESLVVSKTCTPILPIDVMMVVYDICFHIFGAEKCGPWEVKVAHENMMRIHDFCAMYNIEHKTEESYWISVSKSAYEKQIPRFKKIGLGLYIPH